MFSWNRTKKLNTFGKQLQKLKSKIPFFTGECLNFCRDIGLEADVLKADVDAIENCIVSLEERVCDIIPEYVLDGGCARLVEMVSLLDDFLHRKIVYDKSKDKDGGKKRLAEVMSSIHISTRKLDFLRREVEKGVGTDYKKTNWCRIVGCLLVVLGLVAEFVAWLVYYDGCIFVEYYWKLGMALLVLMTGLVFLWKSKRKYDLYAATIDCPYEPKSVEQKNIVRALKLYCLSSDIDYANMINGPWGAGKTYFINTVMRPALHECGKELFYVSLNGVNSFDDVVKQIVFGQRGTAIDEIKQSCVTLLCEKYIPKETAKYVLTNWRDWLGIGRNDAGYIRSRLGDFLPDRSVIFVDDVERVGQVDVLKRLMGKMHEEFVCKGYHVVYSGDESEMGDKPRYFIEKEKYIRRTFDFKLNIDEIVDSIVASYTGLDLLHAKLCVEELKKFAKIFGVKNIRTIKRLMDDFLLLAGTIKDESLVSKIAFVLFYRMAPIANELALGQLNPSDEKIVSSIININDYRIAKYQKRLFGETASSTTEQEGGGNESGSFAEYFVAKYDEKLPLQWDYDQPIGEFELYGIVSPVELKACLSKWVPQSPEKYLKALSVIRSYEEIEDSELVENFPIVVEGLKTGKYSAEYTMLGCAILCRLSENKWINVDCNEIITGAAQGLKERWLNQPNDRINPMILHNRQEDSLQPIVEAIQAETHRREKKLANDEVQKFLDALENKDKDAVWSICPECQTCLIFDKIVESNKCSEFCSVSNWALHLVWYVLKEREPFIRPSSRNSLERLVKEFDKTIQACGKDRPLRKTRLKEVRERFVEILNNPTFKRVSEA